MIKKVLSMAMLFLTALCMNAQMPQMPQLELDPAVKSGKLDNGLTYYILHNEHPKDRANFYIAQKVGSTLEAPTQLGLAHFLEHMAFNGTTNYPGKNMLNYLQSKGIRFGEDINAYTYYDETVYNIDNVLTTDKALMDSVLLCLRDWSCGILLEDAEIDAERGVIEEEWRARNNANFRMLESVLPKIYQEYQYQQSVIGKMDIIRNFPYSEIREYYRKWYRPDQQGIVIVGDFDADEMEAKVKALFSTIPMPTDVPERTYPEVSDNEKPIFAYFDDPETKFPRVDVSFKSDKLPLEMRNTDMYFMNDVVQTLIAEMINGRLMEYAQKPECKYASAGVYFGDFWVSKTKDAFNVITIGKNDVTSAFNEVMGIVARACKTGFTDSELQRAKDKMTAEYETLFKERNNTNSGVFGEILYRHFIDNTPFEGFEKSYEKIQQFLPMVQVQMLNAACAQLLTNENQVVVVSQPRKDGMEVIEEEGFIINMEKILNDQYESYVDEVITDPLISKLPKAGKIKSKKKGAFGTTEYLLSNGVKVVVKPTDFKADEVNLTAFSNGGKQSYDESKAYDIMFADNIFSTCKFGNFDVNTLRKYLAGKTVDIDYTIGNSVNSVTGYSTVKDIRNLFEFVYASFAELSADENTYNSMMERVRANFKARESQPNFAFSVNLNKAQYGNNPMFAIPTSEDIDKVNYASALNFIKQTLSNAADFTFLFTGNIDEATIEPLLTQYIATLPANPKKLTPEKKITSLLINTGQIKDEWKQPMQAPATHVFDIYSDTNLPFSIENATKMQILGSLLSNIFIETLREEEGGTYTPSAAAMMSPTTGEWFIKYTFSTNAYQQARMIERANEELMKLLREGTNPEAFNKVKEAAIKQYENQIRTNSYWDNQLTFYLRGIDMITNGRSAIENLTVAEMNEFMKNLYNGKNRIQVIMEGVAAN